MLSVGTLLGLLSSSLLPEVESTTLARAAGVEAPGSGPETDEGSPEVFGFPGNVMGLASGSLVLGVICASTFESTANSDFWGLAV